MSLEMTALSRRFAALPAAKQRVFLEKLRASGVGFDALPIVPRDPAAPVPMAYAQRALWLVWQRAPQSPAYNLSGRLALPLSCTPQQVQACLAQLVARHEVLCTTYPAGAEGQPLQHIDPGHRFGWAVREWTGSRADSERELAAAATGFGARPFDLERGPVFRGELNLFADGAPELFLAVHHIAADGQSVALLVAELQALLAAPAASTSLRHRPCSTPTTPCGNASGSKPANSKGKPPTGANSCGVRRKARRCRWTVRARRRAMRAVGRSTSRCRPMCRSA